MYTLTPCASTTSSSGCGWSSQPSSYDMPEQPPPTMRIRSPHSGLPSSRRSSEIFFAAVSVIVSIRSSGNSRAVSVLATKVMVSQDATGRQEREILERGTGRERHHEDGGPSHVLGSQHPAPVRSLRDRVPERRVHGAEHEDAHAHALGADLLAEHPAPDDHACLR